MRWLPTYPTHHMAVNFNDDVLAHDGVSQPLRSICEEHHSLSSGYDARNLVSRAAGRSGWKCKVCGVVIHDQM